MRILVTSIGSMSAPFVIKTIKSMNMEVVGVDIYPKKWIATAAEVHYFHQVPITSKPRLYLKKILELCERYRIRMIIPLTDVEVDYYSKKQKIFSRKGIIITISRSNVIDLLRNKRKVYEFFKGSGINVIPTYTQKEYIKKCKIFPCIAKKISGRSSEGLFYLENSYDLRHFQYRDDYVIQPFFKGDIIVVDILRSREGKNIYIARKELLRTKNGAGTTVEIINDDDLGKIVDHFCRLVDFRGCINIEFIKNNSGYFLMDVNPRFSAGVVFSNFAGYNFVENHILDFLGKQVCRIGHIESGVIIARKYTEVVVE